MDQSYPKANLVITKHTRVCKLHFTESDIVRYTSYVDTASGRTVTAPLTHIRLRANAVPLQFPECPNYLSTKQSARESPKSKRRRLESAALQRALKGSAATYCREEEADKISSADDLYDHIRARKSQFWKVFKGNQSLIMANVVEDRASFIKYSVVVKDDMSGTVNILKTSVTRLASCILVPAVAKSKREILEFLENIEKWDADLLSNTEDTQMDVYDSIRFLLEEWSPAENAACVVQFLREQLKLLTAKRECRRYFGEFMIFSCILYYIATCIQIYSQLRQHHPTPQRCDPFAHPLE
ncbi:hypothetical protein HPB49_022671 [Dermacentor silvarum]|uniref:Uncharacterized protein n=1 Tax=Dermacentor silvarum TaxID=543639 RepID=A0ACB8CHR5_DERSI|nr:hypothetical protein HPB49_022671 [Dermacentor silvarum]